MKDSELVLEFKSIDENDGIRKQILIPYFLSKFFQCHIQVIFLFYSRDKY